jgi:hypothetical protein
VVVEPPRELFPDRTYPAYSLYAALLAAAHCADAKALVTPHTGGCAGTGIDAGCPFWRQLRAERPSPRFAAALRPLVGQCGLPSGNWPHDDVPGDTASASGKLSGIDAASQEIGSRLLGGGWDAARSRLQGTFRR